MKPQRRAAAVVAIFTEQGVAMLSSVLNSERAVQVNIEIMRTFVRIKKIAVGNLEILARLDALEKKYNRRFRIVFEVIRQLGLSKRTSTLQ